MMASFSYFAPLLLVIAANTCYHFISKSTSSQVNPFLGLVGAYGVSLLLSTVLFFVTKTESLAAEISKLQSANFLLGLAVLGMESGWILMYRNGWEVSKASVIANICVAMILLAIGVLVFREALSLKKVAGLLICVVGVALINSK